jgi:hypothetical protein
VARAGATARRGSGTQGTQPLSLSFAHPKAMVDADAWGTQAQEREYALAEAEQAEAAAAAEAEAARVRQRAEHLVP